MIAPLGTTYMQKNGETREERARARTEKYVPRYVDQVPLVNVVSFPLFPIQTRIGLDISPVEKRPDCPKSRKKNELGSHGNLDKLYLFLSGELLRDKDLCSVGSDDSFQRRNEEGERQTILFSTLPLSSVIQTG